MQNKKVTPKEAERYGKYLKVNNFDTERGRYTIRIIKYDGKIYFHKMLNGKVREFLELG